MHQVTTEDQLKALYGDVSWRAARKVHDRLDAHDRRFVELSPFLMLASSGAEGLLDVSPRGDLPGFVKVLDDTHLLLPDRIGNNRLDSLLNLLSDPRASLFFLVPGLGQTLRVNGTAVITADPSLLAMCEVGGRLPRTALVVEAVEVLYQCARAVLRSGLWDVERQVDDSAVASLDEVLADQIPGLTLERSRELGQAGVGKPLW